MIVVDNNQVGLNWIGMYKKKGEEGYVEWRWMKIKWGLGQRM